MTPDSKPILTAIYSSPRRNGNSETLLDSAADAAGATVRRIYLRDLDLIPCQNCGYCSTHSRCQFKDGMLPIYEAIDTADILLLGAPIYFCSLCAQAKAIIDRSQPYWVRKFVTKGSAPQRHAVGGFVTTGGYKDDRFLACTEQIVKTWFYVTGIKYAGCCFVPGLDALGDADRHATAKQTAADYGKHLVELFQRESRQKK